MDKFSYISNAESGYLDQLYKNYRNNPLEVDPEWAKFFEGFDFALANFSSNGHSEVISADEFKVYNLILAYRKKGHLIADTNPIRARKDRNAQLKLEQLGFSETDLDKKFYASKFIGLEHATLREIIDTLQKIYCGTLGYEFDYISDPEERQWLLQKIEQEGRNIQLSTEKRKRILRKLNKTTVLEQFLEKKYVGQKRFGLEGGETTIPALDAIIQKGAELGVEEFVFCMAHRGRLNVLANIMGKTYEHIFNEFEGNVVPDLTMGDGDVKYHLGYSSQVTTESGKKVHLKLSPNPSHLEAVNPVMQGFVRAKADVLYGKNWDQIVPVAIHGDAAIAGQGVVYEVLQMSMLRGYRTGGTIHFVINNQIGFTTDFVDARSSNYCTSIATTVEAPVIHVNGDDPDAVVFAVEMATEYRQKFHKDFFVDMVCYRKYGHNEGDDPKYTQPHLYKLIDNHPNPREIYIKKLIESEDFDTAIAERIEKEFWNDLQERLDQVKEKPLPYSLQAPEEAWRQLRKDITKQDFESSPETGIGKKNLNQVLKNIYFLPEGFVPLPKIKRLFESNQELLKSGKVDWAIAELAAYASLLLDKNSVRISGQDVKRGTFSHRHAAIRDVNTDEEINRLEYIGKDQGKFYIYNSLLSEFAVLGFEFGYSLANPQTLVVWEAQFGDFANGAQTIIDQFISASFSKWQRMSGIVLLLPHGYEGQGPEHSSARLDRFLSLCAEMNMVVVNCTTPANFFHVLRRQMVWDFRRPLIVMSPKSLLRHPLVQSDVSELSKGKFHEVIDDENVDAKKVKRVLLCSGKVFYDLLEYQQKNKIKDIAIIRMEQLYPFPEHQLTTVLKKYKQQELFWVQEEPVNMGAWYYILNRMCNNGIKSIARKPSASPATGFLKVHKQEQAELIKSAFE